MGRAECGGRVWGAPRAMGCCQDKDCHTCNEEAKEAELEEVKGEGGTRDTREAQGAGAGAGEGEGPGGWTGEGRAELSCLVISQTRTSTATSRGAMRNRQSAEI